MTESAAPDPQPSPDDTVPPTPSEVTSVHARQLRPSGGSWRRAMMPLGKMARRTRRRP